MPLLPFRKDVPFSLTEVQDEINRLFDRLWHGGLATGPLDGQDWAPPIDVLEEPDRFVVKAELPGLDTSGVEVSLADEVLTIKGNKASDRVEGEGKVYLRKERVGGAFCRSVALTAAVKADQVAATCKKGVLEIILPKVHEARAKSIPVKLEE